MRQVRKYSPEDILSATFCPPPSFAARQNRSRGAKQSGINYEKKAQTYLCGLSDWYLPGPWILYVVAGRPQWCQPDGLHIDPVRGVVSIIEIKYSHTDLARQQLRGVYEPVLRRLFSGPGWQFRCVEVTRWYDPDIKIEEEHALVVDPFHHLRLCLGIHIFRPRGT